MHSQMTEDKQSINVSVARPKSDGPSHSNLEAQPDTQEEAGQTASPVATYKGDPTGLEPCFGTLPTWTAT